jgi:hypothetical protein
MMNTISINKAEHYTWGEGCDGWHLLLVPQKKVRTSASRMVKLAGLKDRKAETRINAKGKP